MYEQPATVLSTQPGADFVETPYIRDLTNRALDYIKAGFPVHFSGPAGIGKTTLALHIAGRIGRPTVLICGDHEFNSSDLVGGLVGYHKKFMKDNFIRSVLKTDESMTSHWVDNRLTTACQHGLTLIYDEFTRSRPEANNVLLSVLAERLLPLPTARGSEDYLKVHPDFTAVFTSNPEEYAGVYRSQDALRDRMVTIELGNFDEETEVAITQARSGLSPDDSRRIVSLVRKVRRTKSKSQLTPTVRGCIVLGRILNLKGRAALYANNGFKQICLDVLMTGVPGKDRKKVSQVIDEFLAAPFPAEANYV
ncbi:MAG: gas vesicle protein GvpN [Chloroflexi bacterium]|nr:gas vesicle protein GvpN [Chloroflexota bacterium]